MKNNLFQEALLTSTEYLKTALAQKSFFPKEPPRWALKSVWEVFEISLQERTNPKRKLEERLYNMYVRALWYLYPFIPESETPLSFLAVVRFLRLLGQESCVMSNAELELGKTVLETLQALQNPEDAIASAIHARLGIHLNS